MKRASYRYAIGWIALNDSNGDSDRLDEKETAHLVTSVLIADLFGVGTERVGKDIVSYRKRHDRSEGRT